MPAASQPEVLGLWYEQFEVGREHVSVGRTITEADIATFSGLTGDFSPIHTDEEYCRKTEYGTRIAHGLLGLCIAAGLVLRTNRTQGTALASLGWDNWRFRQPIKIGDTVRARWRVTTKRESKSKPGVGIISDFIELLDQRGEVLMDGVHTTLVRKRPPAEGAE